MHWLLAFAGCERGDDVRDETDHGTGTVHTDWWSTVGPPRAPRRPDLVATPQVAPAEPGVYLARWLEAETDIPTRLTVTLAGPEGVRQLAFPRMATRHRVPLLELRPGTTYELTSEFTAGRLGTTASLSFTTESLPSSLPPVETVVWDSAGMEPGLTLYPLVDLAAGIGWLVALDSAGELVYLREVPPLTTAVAVTADGGIALNEGGSVAVYDPAGGVRRRWTATPSAAEDVEIDHAGLHHEMVMLPDGSWFSLERAEVTVSEYPTSYADPFDYAPATVLADTVVHVAPDGTTIATYPLAALLDTRRIGYGSLNAERDWAHANGLYFDADSDALLVSMRHQDAVVAIDRSSGAVRWIFGHPHGWSAELRPYLLTPTVPFVWPTHQHAPAFGPDGVLRLFDNGCDGRNSPYHDSGQEGDDYSRILEVRVDESARTVTPVGEYVETSDGPLYSRALGNADLLPLTGNRLGTWGYAPRVVEFAEDGAVVFEATAPYGWRTDRAVRVPTLYPAGVLQ